MLAQDKDHRKTSTRVQSLFDFPEKPHQTAWAYAPDFSFRLLQLAYMAYEDLYELLKIVQQMNQGMNANGKSIKHPTCFSAGCTFNPNAHNLDPQLNRLERKLAAGARYVLTQRVFDSARMRMLAERTAHFGVPVFPGIWPLLNGRQADFLHNEVPGILIPEEVRERMRGAEGLEGQALGIQIAKEMCEEALLHFRSIYLITPFLRYETTVELAQFIRSKV